jgi:hypothetical protein
MMDYRLDSILERYRKEDSMSQQPTWFYKSEPVQPTWIRVSEGSFFNLTNGLRLEFEHVEKKESCTACIRQGWESVWKTVYYGLTAYNLYLALCNVVESTESDWSNPEEEPTQKK